MQTNYDLRYSQGVELIGLGHNWDLHNFAVFLGARYDSRAASGVLSWRADGSANCWGDPTNDAAGCLLRFEGVTLWEVEVGDSQEGDVLAEISSCPQDNDDWHEDGQFALWIRFEDGAMIKVAARSSTLERLDHV